MKSALRENIEFLERLYKVTEGNRYAVALARTIRTDDAGIYIFGPQGTGKTMLTAIMAAEVAERGQTVLWSSVPALLDDIRDNVRTGEQSDAVKALSDVDLLVLDDMGTERLTGYALEKLFIIIDNRYNNYKTTVVTSNLSPTGLMKHIGAVDPDMAKRIVSRLMGMCEICEIHGRDMRMGG